MLPAGNGSAQDDIGDCKVMAGYGVVGNAVGDDATLANWDTLECAVGTWSAGGTLTTSCTSCVGRRTTPATGATAADDCNSEYLDPCLLLPCIADALFPMLGSLIHSCSSSNIFAS